MGERGELWLPAVLPQPQAPLWFSPSYLDFQKFPASSPRFLGSVVQAVFLGLTFRLHLLDRFLLIRVFLSFWLHLAIMSSPVPFAFVNVYIHACTPVYTQYSRVYCVIYRKRYIQHVCVPRHTENVLHMYAHHHTLSCHFHILLIELRLQCGFNLPFVTKAQG